MFFFFFFRRPNSTGVVKTRCGTQLTRVSRDSDERKDTRDRQKVVAIPRRNVMFAGLDPLAYLRRKVRNVHSFGVLISPNSHVAMRDPIHTTLKLLTS